jgi:hypothetical protein
MTANEVRQSTVRSFLCGDIPRQFCRTLVRLWYFVVDLDIPSHVIQLLCHQLRQRTLGVGVSSLHPENDLNMFLQQELSDLQSSLRLVLCTLSHRLRLEKSSWECIP